MPLVKQIVTVAGIEDGFYVNLGIGMPTLVANLSPTALKWFCTAKMDCGNCFRWRNRGCGLDQCGEATVTTLAGSSFFQFGEFCHGPGGYGTDRSRL